LSNRLFSSPWRSYVICLSPALLALFLLACDKPTSKKVDAPVSHEKTLTFSTINSQNTYFTNGDNELAGLEYDLANLFVADLNKELPLQDQYKIKWIVSNRIDQILPNVLNGKADIAAADITITESRLKNFDFSTPYQDVQQQVIYNKNMKKTPPKSLKDLVGLHISVSKGTSFVERLTKLQVKVEGLMWDERENANSEQLIKELADGDIDYTIADNHLVASLQNLHPQIAVAFAIGQPEKIAWAFAKGRHTELREKADAFFKKIKKNGTLRNLIDRYHGNTKRLNPVDVKAFLIRMNTLLPKYIPLFKQAQEITGIDWRLIAAMSYQESHWDTFNTSPTNVRGLMMLTESTADLMGVTDRLDPKQSIPAGAKYISRLIENIPERVPEPDRTFMGLASYNIGYAHVEDARVLAQRLKLNPDSWADVKKTLVMLNNPDYYVNAKYGYCSGGAPVIFVESIRSYYRILSHYQPAHNPNQNSFNIANVDAVERIN
jgi:membrane-bound lytic murein transglycosylase F